MAVAWIDSDFGDDEITYFEKVFDNLLRYYDMTDDQRQILADDLEVAKPPEQLYPHIMDQTVRSELLNFVDIVVNLDGVLDPNENQLVEKLQSWHYPVYNADELMKEIRESRSQRKQEHVDRARSLNQSEKKRNSFFMALDNVLDKFLE